MHSRPRLGMAAAVLILPLSCLASAQGDATARVNALFEQTVNHTVRLVGEGPHTVDLRALAGSIHVTGYEGTEVQLEVRKLISGRTAADRQRGDEEVRLAVVDNASTVEAIVRDPYGPQCGEDGGSRRGQLPYRVRFDFTARVPRHARLRLCTISGPDIQVEGVAGDFNVETVNGRIRMTNVHGAGRAVTVNGRVTVSYSDVPRAATLFKSVNGHIVATFPPALSALLRMKTFDGGLFTDFDVEPPATSGRVERQNGRLIYRANEFTSVRVGQGGPELTFDTHNGDVRILREER